MNLLQRSIIAILSIPLFLGLVACKKEDSPLKGSSSTNGSTPAIDTTQKAKEVEVTEKDHRIYLRPQANTTQRYRVLVISQSKTDAVDELKGGAPVKQATSEYVEFFIRQTVRGVKQDSSVDFAYRIDSLIMKNTLDTAKLTYSSGQQADRNDKRFLEYNALIGQEFGAIYSKQGELMDIYGVNAIVNAVTRQLPDSIKKQINAAAIGERIKNSLQAYVVPVVAYFPAKPLSKDSSWGNSAESNLPIVPVQFPAQTEVKNTVTGFEERDGTVVAVIGISGKTTPTKTTLEQGPAKASLSDYNFSAKGSIRVVDATGLVVQRKLSEANIYTFKLESKDQPGKTSHLSKSVTRETTVDLLR